MLYDKFDLAFHLDDTFHDYVNAKGEPTFTGEEADYLDIVMELCFQACKKEEADIYDIGLQVQQAEFSKRGII